MRHILPLLAMAVMTSHNVAAADVAAGAKVADEVCTTCHIVSEKQAVKPIYGKDLPSFAELAARPGLTEARIVEILKGTHRAYKPTAGMPGVGLTEPEMHDVARYLISLRPPVRQSP